VTPALSDAPPVALQQISTQFSAEKPRKISLATPPGIMRLMPTSTGQNLLGPIINAAPGPAWPWPLLSLAIVLLGALLLLAILMVALMSTMMLRPPRMVGGRALGILGRLSPTDLGLAYESLQFEVADPARGGVPLRLTAWWIPCPGAPAVDQCAILMHGYADSKVGAIAWAPLWHQLGFHVLAVDSRAHGESGGRYCTAGFFERHDFAAVIDQLRAGHPHQTRQLVLFGISMGAALAIATAVWRPADIRAVIVDSPYADFARACFNHAKLVNLPAPALQRLALKLGQWRAGIDLNQVRPVDLITKLPCPLLVIQSSRDLLVSPKDAREIQAATEALRARDGISEYWLAEADHVLALRDRTSEYTDRLAEFLSHLPQSPAPV
jgi:alpha-beta hydrolase superfamily lysophospholipase